MFLHSVNVQERAISADGIETYDLAVNPLSVVYLCLRPLNDTGTLANFNSYLGIAAAMNRVSILYRGESIVSMKGEDIAALAYFRHGIMPYQGLHIDTDNFRRCAVIPLLLGKFPFDPKSCFPATKRGELILEIDWDIADTGYDGMRFSVETDELLGANPSEYEKRVQNVLTWPAVGDNDLDLPPGNPCRGILLFGTTPFTGASPAPSWGRVKTLLDNQEKGFAAVDWEVSQMMHTLWGRQPPMYDAHKHRVTTDGNAQTALASNAGPYDIGTGWQQYSFLDFDPTKDDLFTLQTRDSSRFVLRANAETADAVRAIPIEVIKI